jgi:chemotaxis protein MotB
MADDSPLIVIKKIRKGGHGHHGGAWKVAYADFVTAMMAFFLLLWLLSATSKETKEGIAEYFTPTIGLRDSKGIGFEGGVTEVKDGTKKDDSAPPAIMPGMVPSGPLPLPPQERKLIEDAQEAEVFQQAEKELRQSLDSDPNFREFRDQIVFEQTPEGLKISIRDSANHPMFLDGKAELTATGEKMLNLISRVVLKMPNRTSIIGHTDVSSSRNPNYGNWELSADRANSARRYMQSIGLEPNRTGKVTGRADQELLLPKEPMSPVNRRIDVILLRGSHIKMPEGFESAPKDLLSAPRPIRALPTAPRKQ